MTVPVTNIKEAIYFAGFVVIGLNFLISGILINFFQLLLWVGLKPMSSTLYHKINYYLTYAVWGQMEFLAEWWSSSTCIVYTDDKTWAKMGSEHAILLLNHSYEVDWLFSWFLCEHVRMLGSAKAFVKKSFKKVPIIGWTAFFSGSAFLERSWEKDKSILENQIANMSNYPDPVMLHLFAEGTRYTPEKHAASVEFAQKSGFPPLKHLLVPRTKGFVLSVEKLRGKFPAIYCATMVFDTKEGAAPVFKSLVLGRPIAAEILLERIPLEDIPEDSDKIANWLHENYHHKDKMIDIFKTEGKFPTSLPGHHFEGPIRSHYRPRRLWTLLTIAITSFLTLPTVCRAFYSLFCSGFVNVVIGVVLLGLVFVALLKLMDLSSASKGSAYGHSPRAKAD
ncbi:1-acyl-sn-glycerol-3-phosphate acyltransferase gamma-like [Daphnia carinata]|uniref:1-acyl-sn-glycerol-3-phosphate acyltransferase gamma-like n=1 Tax=Daphnia carinata TaxID=120202 RepID=UPI00257BD6CE|nr:1-acyl-sn-glycerol-3-phosphate acyltransferase gamma-like [Daphnia carinata]